MNDELLTSYLLNEADAYTRQKVEQWIIENPANQRYFEHFRIIWETSKTIELPPSVSEHEAWQRFKQKRLQGEQKPAVTREIGPRINRLRVAATVITVIGALALSYFIWDRTTSAPVTLSTISGALTDTLPDGTSVTLNKNSSISFAGRFKGGARKVQLKGEAFFNVTPNKDEPFIVEVNDVTITVLGTSFNVKNVNGRTEVVVETGMVEVSTKNKKALVGKREKIIVAREDTTLQKQEASDQLYNYYRTREFVCDDTPLWKLVEVLNEVYQSNIVIQRTDLKNLQLTATFNNESLDNILNVISETFNITVQRNANTIILK